MIDTSKLTNAQMALYCANLSSSTTISNRSILEKADENLKWLEKQTKDKSSIEIKE